MTNIPAYTQGIPNESAIAAYLAVDGSIVQVTAANPLPVTGGGGGGSTTVTLAAGSADAGTMHLASGGTIALSAGGTVTTLDTAAIGSFADGSIVTIGSKTDAASAGATASLVAIGKQLHLDMTSALPAGTNNIGIINDGAVVTGSITTQNLVPAGTATAGSAVVYTVNGQNELAIGVQGTYTGALSVQVTMDGTGASGWVTLSGVALLVNLATSLPSSTILSASVGVWSVNVAGWVLARVTGLAAMTGTANITLKGSVGVHSVRFDTPLITGAALIGYVGAKATTPTAATATAITTGGTATVIATGAWQSLFIQNPLTASDQNIATAEVAYLNCITTATANGRGSNIILNPGDAYMFPAVTTGVTLTAIAATTAHAFSVEVFV